MLSNSMSTSSIHRAVGGEVVGTNVCSCLFNDQVLGSGMKPGKSKEMKEGKRKKETL